MNQNKIKILYIEDNVVDAQILIKSLKDVGKDKYELDWVETLAEALIKLKQQHYDLVLADLYLSDAEGVNVLMSIQDIDNRLPIVVISGEDDDAIVIRVMKAGAQDYLLKSKVDGYLVSRAVDYAIERKHIEKGLSFLAQYDSLTGLANRALFRERLSRALIRADRNKKIVALMFIDLDRFKNINDSMGHDVGDELLVEVGKKLTACTREGDTIARLGGDEFTILLEDVACIDDASLVARKILAQMQEPITINGFELYVSPSIGITLYPIDNNNEKDLLRSADAAMYKAKASGRNCYRFYTADLNEHLQEKVEMENNLRCAIENDELLLYYQPKFTIDNRELIGAEALIRWRHANKGMISPALFIPLAEETGLIHDITEWVFAEACSQNSKWQLAGFPPFRMSINLSPKQFNQPNIDQTIFNRIVCADLAPKYIELEITEGALVEDVEKSNDILHSLKKRGIMISVDDFGTGYSSLSYLKKFALDTLKIDQSFVRDIMEDSDDAAIVTAIIALAKSLRLNVIAEGVETKEQLEFLRQKGCNQAQGYYLGKPVPAKEFEQLFLEKNDELSFGLASNG